MQRLGGVAHGAGTDSLGVIFSAGVERPYRRIVLFVAPPGGVSESLVAALEREFPWISVRQVSEPQAACRTFDLDVQLILVDRRLLSVFRQCLDKLSSIHPNATAAVTTEASRRTFEDLTQIISTGAVCGILPMDVNLDIWLSIIRIMLKGGEYFPPALMQSLQFLRAARDEAGLAEPPEAAGQGEQWSETMYGLTGRELEILALVARGHQNKIIASDLGLSEHTVKIHLHNIIRKLRVHNRTEAAAKYFEHVNNHEGTDDDAAGRNDSSGRGPKAGRDTTVRS